MKIGKAAFEFLAVNQPYVGEPMSPDEGFTDEQTGIVSKFRVTTTDELDLIVGVITWPNALPEVKALEMPQGEDKYKRLLSAGRLSIMLPKSGKWMGELRALKYNPESGKANLASISVADLQRFSQQEFLPALSERARIGTRSELVGDSSRKANSSTFLCDANDVTTCAIVYIATRVLAVMYDYGRE